MKKYIVYICILLGMTLNPCVSTPLNAANHQLASWWWWGDGHEGHHHQHHHGHHGHHHHGHGHGHGHGGHH
jgi:hypothetical protein